MAGYPHWRKEGVSQRYLEWDQRENGRSIASGSGQRESTTIAKDINERMEPIFQPGTSVSQKDDGAGFQ